MSRRRLPKKSAPGPRSDFFQLDKFSRADIQRWKQVRDDLLRIQWDCYSALAFQRGRIRDEIRGTLLGAAVPGTPFKGWQRVVKYRYSLAPLSPAGSLKEPGGRFNIPDLHPGHFRPFPALYLSTDKATALAEVLGQSGTGGADLSAFDLALTKADSVACVSVSGKVESIIDLYDASSLSPFIALIRGFEMPTAVAKMADKLGVTCPSLVRSLGELKKSLLEPDWRRMPMQFDVPANCQLFGDLVALAGIEAIRYPSKLTGSDCLAVFPQNFSGDSHIVLDDPAPSADVVSRIDAATWPTAKAKFGLD